MRTSTSSTFHFRKWFVTSLLLLLAVLLHASYGQAKSQDTTSTSNSAFQLFKLEDSNWKFQVDPDDVGLSRGWEKKDFKDSAWKNIQVPSYWENQGITAANKVWTKDDLNESYSGYAWYRRSIEIPAAWSNQTVFLVLGKVDDLDWVYWNGELVGHTGQDIDRPDQQLRVYAMSPDKNKSGKNTLSIRVCDIRGKGGIYEGPVYVQIGQKPDIGTPSDASNNRYGSRHDVVKVGESIHIQPGESVTGDVVSVGGNVVIDGTITGDAVCIGGTLIISSTARVTGDAVCVGGKLDIQPGSVITGQTVSVASGMNPDFLKWFKHKPTERNHVTINKFSRLLFWTFITIIFSLFYVMTSWVCASLFPEKTSNVMHALEEKPFASFFMGLFGIVMIVPVTVLLAITCIGIPLIPIFFIAVMLAWILGIAGMSMFIGSKVAPSLNWKYSSVVGLTMLGMLSIFIIKLVPCIGWLFGFCLAIAGLGAVLLTKYGKPKPPPNYQPPTWGAPVPPIPPVPPTPPVHPVMEIQVPRENQPEPEKKTDDNPPSGNF